MLTFPQMDFESLLRKLKIIQDMTLDLPIGQELFARRLASVTEQKPSSFFFSSVELLRASSKEFTGDIAPDSFTIRRRPSFFNSTQSFVTARGTILPGAQGCVIELELNGFHPLMFVPLGMLLLLFTVVMIQVFVSGLGIFPVLAILLQASVMCAFFYIPIRRGVNQMRYYLERELFFLTKDAA